MKDPRPQLLKEIANFMKRTGMKESRIGRNVRNSPSLIDRIRKGMSVEIDTLLAIDNYMKKYRKPQ